MSGSIVGAITLGVLEALPPGSPGLAGIGIEPGATLLDVGVRIEPSGGARRWRALYALCSTAAIGGLLLQGVPEYVERTVTDVRERPLACVLSGGLTYVAVVAVTVLLARTGVGLVLAVPGYAAFSVVGIAAIAIGYLAVFDTVITGRWRALGLAAIAVAITAAAGVPGIVIGGGVMSAGLGAIVRDWRG